MGLKTPRCIPKSLIVKGAWIILKGERLWVKVFHKNISTLFPLRNTLELDKKTLGMFPQC